MKGRRISVTMQLEHHLQVNTSWNLHNDVTNLRAGWLQDILTERLSEFKNPICFFEASPASRP